MIYFSNDKSNVLKIVFKMLQCGYSEEIDMDKEFKEFCKLALDTWGEDAQIRMCIEEMSELTKELCKYMRTLRNENVDVSKLEEVKTNIIEETADVLNCVEQMALIFGEEKVNVIRKQKVDRCTKIIRG